MKNAHSLNITSLEIHQAQKSLLISGSRDYSLKLWDIPTFQCTKEYKMSRNIITSVATSVSHPNIIFQGSEDLTVKLWDYRTPEATLPSASITGFVYFPLTMDIHQDGYHLSAGCKGFNSVGCNVFVFDLRKLPNMSSYQNNFLFSGGAEADFRSHSQDVTACKFSKLNPQFLYSCSKDGSIYLWNLDDQTSSSFKFPKKYITSLTFVSKEYLNATKLKSTSSSFEYFVVGCMDGSVAIMSFDFGQKKFDVVKTTNVSLDDEEVEY
jgi:WD40 repeat protein